jgi:hypothetical protein
MVETGRTTFKTFKYKLSPTPEQARAMDTALWRCRELYNAGLQERKAAWEQCHVSVSCAMQSAQLPAITEARPEYRDLNAQIMQNVLHQLGKAFQAFFRRVQNGEQPGYPRFQDKDRYDGFTRPQVGAHGEHGGAAHGSCMSRRPLAGMGSRRCSKRLSASPVGWSWTATKTRRRPFCGPGRPSGAKVVGCTERRLRSPAL